jgi:lipoprotein NlpD
LDGAIEAGFNPADPARQGLRIRCRPGDEVHAAAAGLVVYSGSGLKGYGNLIIVKHNKNYLSAYGFNRRLFLKEGANVKRGQAVSECGEGPEGAYLLHFEVRRDGASVNPILYLPPRE